MSRNSERLDVSYVQYVYIPILYIWLDSLERDMRASINWSVQEFSQEEMCSSGFLYCKKLTVCPYWFIATPNVPKPLLKPAIPYAQIRGHINKQNWRTELRIYPNNNSNHYKKAGSYVHHIFVTTKPDIVLAFSEIMQFLWVRMYKAVRSSTVLFLCPKAFRWSLCPLLQLSYWPYNNALP